MNLHLQARALLMPVIRQKFEKYDREGQKVDIAANLRGRRTNLLLLGFFFLSALHDAYRVTKGGKSRPCDEPSDFPAGAGGNSREVCAAPSTGQFDSLTLTRSLFNVQTRLNAGSGGSGNNNNNG